jgi:AraC-like DNA-binding protein
MTEPLFQHIYLNNNQSYNLLKVDRPYFIVPWHFHPEIEIMSVIKGEGTRFVGDHIGNFGPGDLVMVGANIRHCWKNGPMHHEGNPRCRAKAHVILFRENSFGKDFFKTSELVKIHELLERAGRGVRFTGKTQRIVSEKIMHAYAQRGVKRFIAFIDILDQLAESKEYTLLSGSYPKTGPVASDMQRLNQVLDFMMKNFKQPVKLEEIAAQACMSPTAFCRYFKAHTNKTVINFLNELRIGFAKKQIMEELQNINEICYSSGFNNVSNFYEQFKKVVGCSPLQFRKMHKTVAMDFV